jgi:hypothetical protein
MVKLMEKRLSPGDIKALFVAIAAVRGQGGEGIATKASRAGDAVKSKFSDWKQKLTQSAEYDEMQRLRELAGITEAPAFWAKMKQKAGDAKDTIQGKYADTKDAIKRNTQDKIAVDVYDITDAWKAAGSPDDFEEIVQVLKSLSFTGSEIKTALVNAKISNDDSSSDPKITNFANAIIKSGYQKEILQYLESIGVKESISEKVISDSSIKDIFMQIVDDLEDVESIEDREEFNKPGQETELDTDPDLGDMDLQDSIDFEQILTKLSNVSIMLEQARYGRTKRDVKY